MVIKKRLPTTNHDDKQGSKQALCKLFSLYFSFFSSLTSTLNVMKLHFMAPQQSRLVMTMNEPQKELQVSCLEYISP